jgi:ABC-2 type transport system permease protein
MTLYPVYGIVERELYKLLRQRARLLSSLVRPMIWLLVIGAGFEAVMAKQGGSYQNYLVPGVLGMTMLFGAMLAALSTVNDKESGVMRLLVIAPVPHYWIILARTLSAALAALVQALLLLVVLGVLGYLGAAIDVPLLVLGMVATAIACASLGMLTAAFTKTMENYAVLMNLVIFPVFFLSGSLYPVQSLPAYLHVVALVNPFTYGVDLLKHAMLRAQSTPFGLAEFTVALDVAVLLGFSALACAVACLRFSREAACEPLVHGGFSK